MITLGIDLGASIYNGNHDGWDWIWIYFLGEALGVLIATTFYDKVFEPIIKRSREARRESFGFDTQFSDD